jgi:hypothetical protein
MRYVLSMCIRAHGGEANVYDVFFLASYILLCPLRLGRNLHLEPRFITQVVTLSMCIFSRNYRLDPVLSM